MEIEIRARIKNVSEFRKKLRKVGAKYIKKALLSDYYFGNIGLYQKLGKSFLIRIRQESGKVILCHKSPTEENGVYIEYEQQLQDIDTALSIFNNSGLDNVINIRKVREIYKLNNYTILIDKVEDRGCFVEIEQISDTPKKKDMENILTQLGIDKVDIEHKGYITLFLEEDRSPFRKWIKN